MSKIHSSHLGIKACLPKARDSVFWPNMTGDVRKQVSQCSICAELESQNPKPSDSRPPLEQSGCWPVQASRKRLHSHRGFLLWFHWGKDVGRKHTKCCDWISERTVSRHGLPDILVTDKGPQFRSQEFKQFTHSWEFVHVCSSPHHPLQSRWAPGTEIDVPPHKICFPNGHKSPISESARKFRSAAQAKKTESQVLSWLFIPYPTGNWNRTGRKGCTSTEERCMEERYLCGETLRQILCSADWCREPYYSSKSSFPKARWETSTAHTLF